MTVLRRVKTFAVTVIALLSVHCLTAVFQCGSRVAATSVSSIAADSVAYDAKRRAATALAQLPLHFEANSRGGAEGSTFIARTPSLDFSLTPTEAVIGLRAGTGAWKGQDSTLTGIAGVQQRVVTPALPRHQTALRMQLIGSNQRARLIGENQLSSHTNYFIGSDPHRWRRDVPNYARVKAEQVYRGIDLTYYGRGESLEYDFTVAPGATFRTIRLRLIGANSVRIDNAGDLVVAAAAGELRQHKPIAYQLINGEHREVAARYALKGKREFSFIVGNYDKNVPLIIDPVLAYSTLLGGDGADVINSVAVDSQGNTYVAGITDSSDFPITPGVLPSPDNFQSISSIGFVAKLDLTNSVLVYSTYLGGSKRPPFLFVMNECRGISLDSSGNAYITGKTSAANFPTTVGAFQQFLAGGVGDAFVAKLNASGSALLYSTYLGSSKSSDTQPLFDDIGVDEGVSIAVDPVGSAYVTGRTTGSDFPVTPGAFKTTHGNDVFAAPIDVDPPLRAFADVFITKLNPTGSALLYSTYLGGRGEDSGSGISVDAAGSAYVVGTTEATDFPTLNALQTARASGVDAFVTKLTPNGSGLVYSTYLGGSGRDRGNALALDESGSVFVTGDTNSTDLPTTSGAFQRANADVNLFKSTNGGANWSAGNIGILSDASVSRVVVDPANSSILYASALNLVFNSTDGGRSWQNASSDLSARVLAFDPRKPSTIYAVRRSFFSTTLLKSLDGGRTWGTINSNFPSAQPLQDIHLLAIDPVNTSTLYAFTNSGLFKTTDGLSWVERDNGLFDEAGFLDFLVIDPANPSRLFASTGGKLHISTNGGKKWQTTSLGDLFVLGLTFDPITPSTVFASGAGLFKSTDSGDSWQEIENDLPDIGAITIDPTNALVLYTPTSAGTFKSADGGHHWSAINNGLRTNAAVPASLISFLAVDPRNAATLYAAGAGSGPEVFVAKLNPSGSGFVYFTYLGGAGSDSATGIAVDPAGNAYVTGQSGSEDFPIRKAVQPDKFFFTSDVFVSKLSADGASLAYSTYLGGTDLDVSSAIAVDGSGNAFVAGRTFSVNFPLARPLLSTFRTTKAQAFLAEIADVDSSQPPPSIFNISPQAGASTGQYAISINGANFMPGARVRLGGVPVTLIEVTPNHIAATVNARPAGVVNVVVSNPDGQSATLTRGFSFLLVPVIEAVEIEGKVLKVFGRDFDKGAVILLDGSEKPTQQALALQARGTLQSKKAAKRIVQGQMVPIQVRNLNGLASAPFNFIRPPG